MHFVNCTRGLGWKQLFTQLFLVNHKGHTCSNSFRIAYEICILTCINIISLWYKDKLQDSVGEWEALV